MARPTKYTIELAKRICAHIRDGANREDAAQACGVCSSTLANWMDKHPQFLAWVMEADSQSTIGAEAKAYERDPVRWLQAKRPLIWGNLGKTTVEHTGADGAPIQHRVTIEPDADAITAAADALRAAALAARVADPTE